jgi:hypothetical protein
VADLRREIRDDFRAVPLRALRPVPRLGELADAREAGAFFDALVSSRMRRVKAAALRSVLKPLRWRTPSASRQSAIQRLQRFFMLVSSWTCAAKKMPARPPARPASRSFADALWKTRTRANFAQDFGQRLDTMNSQAVLRALTR